MIFQRWKALRHGRACHSSSSLRDAVVTATKCKLQVDHIQLEMERRLDFPDVLPPKNQSFWGALTPQQKRSKVGGLAKIMMNMLVKHILPALFPANKLQNIYVDSCPCSVPHISPVLPASCLTFPQCCQFASSHHSPGQRRQDHCCSLKVRETSHVSSEASLVNLDL